MYGTGGGVDYSSGPYTVTFPAGATSASFDVPINDDSTLESDEQFTITIDPSSLPRRVSVTNPGQAVITITDNDGEWIVLICITQLLVISCMTKLKSDLQNLPVSISGNFLKFMPVYQHLE